VITGSNYEIRSSETFEKLGWEKIEIILKKREHIMTFKALGGETQLLVRPVCRQS
jgi:hypothetical protein